jgi:hypothetical protein
MNTFIILTIISLIITLLYYFGIIRYFEMHFSGYEKYLNNYKNLEKASEKNKVVISLTTTPDKIKKLKPILNSLLDQTVKVDQIALNIPKDKEYNIPQEYNDILNVFYCGQDYGCATKFIPTILREDSENTIILILDDKYIYGKDYIETMIEHYNKDNCSIISKHGILITPKYCDMDIYKRDDILDDNWIQNCIKSDKKNISYNENYKSFIY